MAWQGALDDEDLEEAEWEYEDEGATFVAAGKKIDGTVAETRSDNESTPGTKGEEVEELKIDSTCGLEQDGRSLQAQEGHTATGATPQSSPVQTKEGEPGSAQEEKQSEEEEDPEVAALLRHRRMERVDAVEVFTRYRFLEIKLGQGSSGKVSRSLLLLLLLLVVWYTVAAVVVHRSQQG